MAGNLTKPMENFLSARPEKAMQKPYKMNGNPALFWPKSEKALQQIGKALPGEGFRNAFSRRQKTL